MSNAPRRRPGKPAGRPDKPINGIVVEDLQREGAPSDAFYVELGGQRVEWADPFDMDWRDLKAAYLTAVETGDEDPLLTLALGEDGFDYWCSHKIAAHRVSTIVETWMRYYGFSPEALGNPTASRA